VSLAVARTRRRLVHGRSGSGARRSGVWLWAMGLVGIFAIAATLVVAAAIWAIVWFGQFAGALPPPDQLTAQTLFQTTPVLASDGTTRLYELTDPR